MVKKIFSSLQYIIFLGGGLLLVWWQLRGMTPGEKTEFNTAFREADYVLVIPVILMNLLSHLSRSMRWKLLLESLGYYPKLKNVFGVTMIGYFANAAVPRLGEVLKCTLLARYENLKSDKLIGTILIERAFDFFTYILFILFTVFIQLNVVGNYTAAKMEKLANSGSAPLWLKALILFGIIFLIIVLVKKIFSYYPENKTFIKIKNFGSGIAKGFMAVKNLKKRRAFILHTVFIWSMYLLQIYLGFKAMEGTAHLGIKAACSVLSLSTLAMIVTPGGIGTFPFFVMETLGIYGITASQGKAFGWLIWGVSTGIVIISGLISLLLMPYLNKKKNEVSTGSIS